MDHDHGKDKGKIPATFWVGLILILIGIFIGAYASPTLDPLVNPERAQLVENSKILQTQNELLKQQIDCLVNGIELSNGKATIAQCT